MTQSMFASECAIFLSAVLLLSFSGCAHTAVGVRETCLPVPGQNLFECISGEKPDQEIRSITAQELQGFGCFPLDDIKDVFHPVKK